MFTPGDNDWTDCDRPNNGKFNSLERLTHERQVFFIRHSRSGSTASVSNCSPTRCVSAWPTRTLAKVRVGCVENRRWTVGGVTYATLNIQGSCNNLCGDGADAEEYKRGTEPTSSGWRRRSTKP